MPPAVRLDPDAAGLPPVLDQVLTDPAIPILLLVAPDAGEQALKTAVALADLRGSEGLSTVLADAAVSSPRLHQVVDVPNVEGLADLFLFGASFEHVRRRPSGRHFDFVPTGAYVPEPESVLDSSRWGRIGAELQGAGTMLLLFTTAGTPGIGSLSRRIGRAVVLDDGSGVDRLTGRLDDGCDVLAVITPAGPGATAGTAPAEGESDAAYGAGAGDMPDGAPVAAAGGAPAAIPEEPDLSEPPILRDPPKSRRVSPLLLVALAIAAGAGAWFLYQEYGPAGEVATGAPAVAEAAPPPSEPERGEPVETPVPISVAVEAHQNLESAWQRARTLSEEEPSVRFYLAPVSVNETLYYRLLAGPVATRDAGMALMRRLVEADHKTAFDSWAVRPTELAFHLGEYDTRQEAGTRVDSLWSQGVPAYVVEVDYEPGEPRYRVYGGAFENESDAGVMQQMLEEAGVEARLVPRTGQPVLGGQ